MSLHIPVIAPDDDVLTAALAYAAAGWYILPVKMSTKHPGSVVGKDWPRKSSREPEVLVSWYAGTSGLGIALHLGRSGALAVDVDKPEAVPNVLTTACVSAVHQSTRTNVPHRGHYLFAMPPGRNISNSNGQLGKDWGEIRGRNGVVIVEPSSHEKAATGGRYQWVRTGVLPVLPESVASLLSDAFDATDAATDAVVSTFLAEHTTSTRPELVNVWCALFAKDVKDGASRHMSMLSKLAGAMKEAGAGLIEARAAADTLESMFLAAVAQEPQGKQGAARSGAFARNEWRGLLAWAVAQALAADLDETRARVAEKMPSPSPIPTTPKTDTTIREVADTTQEAADETPAERAKRLFPRLDWAALWADEDEEEWIHDPLLPARRSVVIYSAPKVGKSLLMLEMAVAISRGETFLGYTGRQVRVLYVDFENDPRGDVRSRLQAMGYSPGDLDGLDYLSYPSMAGLDTERGALELLEAVNAYRSEVVVIDTVSRAVDGKENENDTYLAMYRHTGLALKRAGVAIIRLDHSGKDEAKGQRGASAKSGDVDAVWKLTRVTDDRFRLECTDSRMSIGTKSLLITRHTLPRLHHGVNAISAVTDRQAKIAHIIGLCNANGIPTDATRKTVTEFIKSRGMSARNDILAEVVRLRKSVPDCGDKASGNSAKNTVPIVGNSGDSDHVNGESEHESLSPPTWGQDGTRVNGLSVPTGSSSKTARDGTTGQETEPDPNCSTCGASMSWQRLANGKTQCTRCEAAS